MFWNAQNGVVKFRDGEMECIRFGSGEKVLVMLPGLGDGLRTMKGMAIPFAFLYRRFAKEFTVYAFSRKRKIPAGYTTRDMARDLMIAMKALGIRRAHLLGVSMGGMIAQHFAADYPEMVEKLVLTVTCARANPVLIGSLTEWMDQAKQGDHRALMDSNVRRIYTDGYYRRRKWLIPILGAVTKPKSYDRFLRQAESCLTHYAWDRLRDISAPTLVIGGEEDKTLGGEASRKIAAAIPNATLKMYPGQGHGLYEEAGDFNETVLEFLTGSPSMGIKG